MGADEITMGTAASYAVMTLMLSAVVLPAIYVAASAVRGFWKAASRGEAMRTLTVWLAIASTFMSSNLAITAAASVTRSLDTPYFVLNIATSSMVAYVVALWLFKPYTAGKGMKPGLKTPSLVISASSAVLLAFVFCLPTTLAAH